MSRTITTHPFMANPRRDDSCQALVSRRWPQDEECGGTAAEHVTPGPKTTAEVTLGLRL